MSYLYTQHRRIKIIKLIERPPPKKTPHTNSLIPESKIHKCMRKNYQRGIGNFEGDGHVHYLNIDGFKSQLANMYIFNMLQFTVYHFRPQLFKEKCTSMLGPRIDF